MGVGVRRERSCRLGRIGHRLWRQDHQHAVRGRVAGRNLERLRVPRGLRVADDVDRVVVAPDSGQHVVVAGHRALGQRGQLAATADERVRGDNGRATGIGHDRQVRPGRPWLLGEHVGDAEQVADALDAQHADPAERRVEHLVGAGQRSCVRGRSARRLRRATRLDDDDRLGQRHLARGGQEGARIADRLHVDQDRARAGVVAQVVDDVAPADIGHRPKRHDLREADALAGAPVEDGREQGARLGDEADRSCGSHFCGEGGVQAVDRIHHAEAVRADYADARLACDLDDALLEGRTVGARLTETGADDDRALDAGGRALGHDPGHGRRGSHDHREIDRAAGGRERRVGTDAEDVVALRVDGHDRAAERAADQVPEHRPSDAALFFCRADNRH